MSRARVSVSAVASSRELQLRFPRLRGMISDNNEVWLMFDKNKPPAIVAMLQEAATKLQDLEKSL